MEERPYLTFDGKCNEAIELYKRAFKPDTLEIIRFEDLSPKIQCNIGDSDKKKVVQATFSLGSNFIRMSDRDANKIDRPSVEPKLVIRSFPKVNAAKMDRTSIVVETNVETVQSAFSVLAEEGYITMPLSETFYSPCAGSIFDKFGIMWKFAARK